MKIIKSSLPDKSVLNTDGVIYDYVDSFQGVFVDRNGDIRSAEIGRAFFTSEPKWVSKLFTLRNRIVKLFGLKTSGKITDRQQLLDNFKCEQGEQIGLFKVFQKSSNEVVLGENDKHLDFRVSLFIDQLTDDSTEKNLTISTTVKFQNWFGRLYFIPVRPFHKLIVPAMLKSIIKELEK